MKCLNCVGMYKQNLSNEEEAKAPAINDAVSMVPMWQTKQVPGAIIYACVTVPSCMDCMDVQEMSEVEKAMQGGILLPAQGSIK